MTGLSNKEREQAQNDFVYDRVRVVVATNAFGMGIDKSNVQLVILLRLCLNNGYHVILC